MTPETVSQVRSQLWDAGFRPLAVLNSDHAGEGAGKAPIGKDWPNLARQDPPNCLNFPPVAHALNTGVLCDGLRPFDIDIDDKELATRCRSLIMQRFGNAPVRMRANSPRCMILYRAAQGAPSKLSLAGKLGKIEVLGRGNQFVAFGKHPSGADLQWFPQALGNPVALEDIPAVLESEVLSLLNELAPLIHASPVRERQAPAASSEALETNPLEIAAALNVIPNAGPADWESWNNVGMAVYAATGGSELGFQAFDSWSARNPAYDAAATRKRWDHYPSSPPSQTGAGKIMAMAAEASRPDYFNMHGTRANGATNYLTAPGNPAPQHDPETGEILPAFPATPFDPAELVNLPARRWVYGHFLIRQFLSVLGAPGGTGKTAYAMTVGVSVATGKPLLGEVVHDPGPVWIYNLEDPRDEVLRRLHAICLLNNISPAELAGKVYLDSGRDRPLVMAARDDKGNVIASPVVDDLVAELKRRGIRLFIPDPFVKSHRLEENRNEQIDFAATLWNKVAAEADCSILLPHHFRKGGTSGEADAFRGASALIDAARAAVSQATMSEKDAEKLGIEDDQRRFHVRIDNAKLNLAPPPAQAVWIRLNNVELPNGDKVQAVSRWEPPSAWDGLSMSMCVRILDKLHEGPGDGERYTLSKRGGGARWAGNVVADIGCKTDSQAHAVIQRWTEEGLISTQEYTNKDHKKVSGVNVDLDRLAEMRQSVTAFDDE